MIYLLSKGYESDDFRQHTKSHQLLRRETGKCVPLTPRTFTLLLEMVENEARVWKKDELLEKVGDSFVKNRTVRRGFRFAQNALENTKEPTFISRCRIALSILSLG